MRFIDLMMILSFGAPLFISLVSIGMLSAHRQAGWNDARRKILALTIGCFASVFVSNLTVIFFIYEPDYYIYTSPLSFLSLLLSVVFFYDMIRLLISGERSKPLSRFHYMIPLALSSVHGVWSLFVPYEVQYDIVVNRTLDMDNYPLFCLFYTSKLWLYAVYVVLYTLFLFKRMPAYRRYIINYSADEERASLRWIHIIIVLAMVIIPVSFITFLINFRSTIMDELLIIIANLLYAIELVTLQYNMFTENYVIISPETKEPSCTGKETRTTVDRELFERYMEEKKPYCNPHLKITDILYEFSACRSYMSTFINRTYGMNFSTYINTLRMQEYKRLKNDPAHQKKSDAELISQAGFTYRGFLRFRKNKESE